MLTLPYVLASSAADDHQKEMAKNLLERTAPLSETRTSYEPLLKPIDTVAHPSVGDSVSRPLDLVRITVGRY